MVTPQDKRSEERFVLEMPVLLENGMGLSRDVSRSGIYFTTDQPLTEGGTVSFSVKLQHVHPGKPFRLDCQGRVLRVEAAEGKHGVAASISEFWCVHLPTGEHWAH